MPIIPSIESIFATGGSDETFNGDNDQINDSIDSSTQNDLLELANGIFDFDTVEDLTNSIDENYAMLLDIDCGVLGLGLDDQYMTDNNNIFENQDHISNQDEIPSIDAVTSIDAVSNENSNQSAMQTDQNFEFNETDSDMLNVLEGIENMPWFDALLN